MDKHDPNQSSQSSGHGFEDVFSEVAILADAAQELLLRSSEQEQNWSPAITALLSRISDITQQPST